MEVAFQLLVGAIIVALGANLFTKAPEDASAHQTMIKRWGLWSPGWGETVQRWSNRGLAVFLIVFGIAICLDALV